MAVNLKSLIAKTNDTNPQSSRRRRRPLSRQHSLHVEVEHFLFKLLDQQDSDFHHIAKYFNINTPPPQGELNRALERNRRGNSSTPCFGLWLEKMLTSAWTLASLDFSAAQIRSGYCLLALVTDEELQRVAHEISVPNCN